MIAICFHGCINMNSDKKLLIYYDGQYYNSSISNDYAYNSFWYPLKEATISDKAFTCNENDDVDKLDKRNEIEIKKFSDEELNMFISYTDFWDDWLFADTNYKFPSLSSDNIEMIALKNFSQDKEWIDYYYSDDCVVIQNKNDIENIINTLNNLDKSNNAQSYNMNEVNNQAEICVKFKEINALYYLGIIAYADDNVVFYNSHGKINSFYLLYDNNTESPFDVLK